MILLLILAAVVGGIPYLLLIMRTCRAKDWRKLRRMIAYPVIGVAVLLAAGHLSDHLVYRKSLEAVFDGKMTFSRPIFEYDSERGFQGDGYSFAVYPLSESIRQRFVSADLRLTGRYPERPADRDRWKTHLWTEAPFDPALDQYLEFALSSLDAGNEPRLEPHFSNLRAALGKKRTWYSYFHHDHGDSPGNIDFFAVDLDEGRVYLINHNT
ncbi:hypothetical protein OKA04_04980 [Luteolibacter flavescens]|uniref:Uncharacterized protein n=1 Tax=Luteolibacter flavescens TaxID=1859460 RepID=A0ABT3FKH5_9BACT|nr:hypothetical protein [Luteolibacter flavescens]MCW1884072.1 hypothetical protein [Luteolibacter flavescens]